MLKIKTKTQPYIYNKFKNSFKDGIEFKRIPFETFYEKKIDNIKPDTEATGNIIKDIYKSSSLLELIRKKAHNTAIDLEKLNSLVAETSYRDQLIEEGRFKLENTFLQGSSNPDICLMAWYDALAEHVLEVANSLVSKKAPIPTIQDELKSLSISLSKDIGLSDAKTNLYNSLKKLYPKTYKTRLKICEQRYNQKVENGISEIVKRIIAGR